jgi:hypothetical protein
MRIGLSVGKIEYTERFVALGVVEARILEGDGTDMLTRLIE